MPRAKLGATIGESGLKHGRSPYPRLSAVTIELIPVVDDEDEDEA